MTSSTDLYPLNDRAKARLLHKRLMDLAERIANARRGGEALRQIDFDAACQLSGSTDPETQFKALTGIAEEARKVHIDRLVPMAKADFPAYCEVMTPDEPPVSPWLQYLTGKLQEIEYDPSVNNLILNCPPGHAKPVAEDETVTMGDGTQRLLKHVAEGDLVMSHLGPRRVTAVHIQGSKPCVEVVTVAGRRVRCAPDHPFKTPGGFLRADALMPGQRLETAPASPEVPPSPQGALPDAVFVLAGCWAMTGSVGYTLPGKKAPRVALLRMFVSQPAALRRVGAALSALGGGASMHPNRSRPGSAVVVGRRSTVQVLAALGVDITQRQGSRRVPAWVFRAPAAQRRLYLETIFEARGRADAGATVLAHLSEDYIRDVQALAAGLGVDAAVDRKGRDWRVRLDAFGLEGAAPPLDVVASVTTCGRARMRCLTVEEAGTFTAGGVVVKNSTYASRLFVSWRMGRDPDMKVLGASHTQDFVEKEFSKRIRDTAQTEEFRRVFPNFQIDPQSRANNQWNIAGHRGQYVARGVGQSIHGFRFNMAVIDDPYPSIAKAKSASYREEVKTFVLGDVGTRMLPGAKIFLIMTRFHEEDITQTLVNMNESFAPEFRFIWIAVPAVCYNPETDVMGRQLGDLLWDFYDHNHFVTQRTKLGYAQYSLIHQQMTDAVNPDSLASKFQTYKVLPHLTKEALADAPVDPATGERQPQRSNYFRRVILSVDTASKDTQRADYSVAQVWGESVDRRYYLMDQSRQRVDFNDLIVLIERLARRWDVDAILVEDKGNGLSYIQNRAPKNGRRLAPAPVIPITIPSTQGKAIRLDTCAPMIEGGEVFVPENAPWLDSFMQEVGQFPNGAHDDQVDATSQALNYFRSKRQRKYGAKKVTSFG